MNPRLVPDARLVETESINPASLTSVAESTTRINDPEASCDCGCDDCDVGD